MHRVSVVECGTYELDELVKAVKRSIDGIGFKIEKGTKVLLKPNILEQAPVESAVITHPNFVEAVCIVMDGFGCKISIGEGIGFFREGGTMRAFSALGYDKISRKYNARLIAFGEGGIRKITCEDGKIMKEFDVVKSIFGHDMIISLPKLKTHCLTKMTGAVKNMYGAIPGGMKQHYHLIGNTEEKFCSMMIDIFSMIKPNLSIMDAVTGMEGEGPGRAGTPRKTGLVLASENGPALDIVASRIIGYDPMDVYTNKFASERGLVNPEKIEVIGKEPRIGYKKPASAGFRLPPFLREWAFKTALRMYPRLNREKCTRCGICIKVCRAGAMVRGEDNYPRFIKRKCINCYCCHENCPSAAICLRRSSVINALSWIKAKAGL